MMIKKEEQNIHMLRKYIDYPFLVTLCRLFIIVFEIMIFMTIISYKGWLIITAPLFLAVAYKIDAYLREVRKNFVLRYSLRNDLLSFIRNNKIYEEELRQVVEGNNVKKRKFIVNTAVFNYRILENDKLIIEATKRGDSLSKRMEALDVELESLIGLELTHKIIRPTLVEYHFWLQKPERLIVKAESGEKLDWYTPIDLGYGVKYNPINCPHVLISGGTGSGKSIFISTFILELVKRDSILFIVDPKQSDLSSLSHYLGSEKVGTDLNNIARIFRLVATEMRERYKYMNDEKNFKYGANFAHHNLKPVWLVADEIGSLVSMGIDKKSKEILVEIMNYFKQIVLLGRQAGCFILVASQQVRAETLSTDLRDNLGLRVALGANSSEGYRMIFGSSTPEQIQPIEKKGSGYLYMQGSGKEFAEYYEAPFLNENEVDFIEELTKLL